MHQLRSLFLCGLTAASLTAGAASRTVYAPARLEIGATAPLAQSILAGDFNGDGKQDVLAADDPSPSPMKIRVTRSLGNGAFDAVAVTDAAGFVPTGTAHFNGDAHLDLCAVSATGQIAVLFGIGNGTFAAPVVLSSTVAADDVLAGDFTGDGKADLALISDDYDQLVIYAGNGGGTFPLTQTHALPLYTPNGSAAGDFDGDGRLDLAITGIANTIVAWNDGTSFAIEYLAAGSGEAVKAGDLDGDGIKDVVLAGRNEHLSVSFGRAERGLPETRVPGVYAPQALAVGRFDGDARDDVVAGDGALSIVTHDGTAFRTVRTFGTGERAYALAAADFDGDSKMDVAGVRHRLSTSDDHYVWLVGGNGDGTLQADVAFDLLGRIGTLGWGRFLFDVNGDGELDIVAVTYVEDEIAVLFGNGDGTFDDPVYTELPNGYAASIHEAADLNGDGRKDVVWWDPGDNPIRFQPFFSQTNGTFVAGTEQTTPSDSGTHTRLLPVIDYTGDGKPDLFENSGWLHPGLGNGAFGARINTGIDTWAGYREVTQVNGDALPDVIVFRSSTFSAYLNTGGGTFAAPVTHTRYGGGLSVADLNGDGFADLTSPAIALGDGNGTFVDGTFFLENGVSVAADFDSDGKTDLAGSSAIFYGTGTGAFDGAAHLGPSGDILSTEDFDGNGSADLWMFAGMLTIVRTGAAPAGTVASQTALTTPVNPVPFGSYGLLEARPVPPTANPRPRGAILFSRPPSAPFGMELTGANGSADWYISAPPIDTPKTYSASFTGDSRYLPSTSSSLTITSTRGTTATTVTPGKPSYVVGETVAISVFAQGGSTPTTGTIVVRKNGEIIRTLAAPGTTFGIASSTIFPVGTHMITAEYSGDGNYLPSTSGERMIVIRKPSPGMNFTISPVPANDTQTTTLTAAFPNNPDVTGSVSFRCFDRFVASVAVAGAQAVLSTTLPWGNGTCTAVYSGDEKYAEASRVSYSMTVQHGTAFVAPHVYAYSYSTYEARVNVSPIAGAASYDLYRSLDGAPMTLVRNSFSTEIYDHIPADTKVAVYAAAARNSGGAVTALGPRDLTSFVLFTDTLKGGKTLIRAVHVTELQSAVNAVRIAAGLATTTFAAPDGVISAAHLTSLRQALTQARGALGIATTFTDPAIEPGITPVRAIHWQELRDGVE